MVTLWDGLFRSDVRRADERHDHVGHLHGVGIGAIAGDRHAESYICSGWD
jgi:hypothetical protein